MTTLGDFLKEIQLAESRIRPHIRETILDHSLYLSQHGNANVYCKLENLQYTGSFKTRGAMNKVLSLTPEEQKRGVVTASTGNHGAAVACGATINQDAFYKIPKDLQKILLDLRKETGLRYAQALQDLEKSTYENWASKHGVTIKELTPEESRFNQKALVEAREIMIKEQENKGHKGARAVWDFYSTAMKKYQKERAK